MSKLFRACSYGLNIICCCLFSTSDRGKIKIPAASGRGIFISFIDRLRGKPARTATQGERTPAPLENPHAKCPSRQAAEKSSDYHYQQRNVIPSSSSESESSPPQVKSGRRSLISEAKSSASSIVGFLKKPHQGVLSRIS